MLLFFLEEVGSMKFSIMPRSEKHKQEDRQKPAYILPEYLSGGEGAEVSSAYESKVVLH